jgi:mono/diheme cytochrome c family protein
MNGLVWNGLLGMLASVLALAWATPAGAAPRAVIDNRHRPVLEAHCQKCHGAETQESGVRVDDLPLAIDTVAAAERWQKVLNVLNSGEMPPVARDIWLFRGPRIQPGLPGGDAR